MSKLSIKEKEYAISRASGIIDNKYRDKIKKTKTPTDNEVYKALGYPPKDFSKLRSYGMISNAIDFHPAFKKLKDRNKAINSANDKIVGIANLEKQVAKDFIMLGDRDEVFEYIKNLGE